MFKRWRAMLVLLGCVMTLTWLMAELVHRLVRKVWCPNAIVRLASSDEAACTCQIRAAVAIASPCREETP